MILKPQMIILIMNLWNIFDQNEPHNPYGYYALSDRFKNYYEAHCWLEKHPEYMYKELPLSLGLSCEVMRLIYIRELNQQEYEVLCKYSLNELKEKVEKNYYLLNTICNKQLKKSWAKALVKTKKWSINTFSVISNLPHDLLDHIYSFY